VRSAEVKFNDYLKDRGLKYTPQRKVILKKALSVHNHFDADGLYDKLRTDHPFLSRATVYRTLPLLVKAGLVRETMRCQGRASYEHTFGHEHHDHLICIKCGKITEFKDEKMEKLQNQICKKHRFLPVEHRLGIRGYCAKCRPKA
jgi:Fur family transcriptional regulator, ferric uptake regulator